MPQDPKIRDKRRAATSRDRSGEVEVCCKHQGNMVRGGGLKRVLVDVTLRSNHQVQCVLVERLLPLENSLSLLVGFQSFGPRLELLNQFCFKLILRYVGWGWGLGGALACIESCESLHFTTRLLHHHTTRKTIRTSFG